MSTTQRVLLATVIVLVDLAIFMVPITAIVLAVMIIGFPDQLKQWVAKL